VNTLVCIGFGYCAEALARRLREAGDWFIFGTSRTLEGRRVIAAKGFDGLTFDGEADGIELADVVSRASHMLISAPPDAHGDPVLRALASKLGEAKGLHWLGYLSTIGVYGDSMGDWVDEDAPPHPSHDRALRRLAAEQDWLEFGGREGVNVQIFRIGGIYGPGRNALADLKAGRARRIVKLGQVFNRIHVADVALALEAAMLRGRPGRVYNLTDDEPAAPDDVIRHAAELLGIPPPPPVAFEAAALSPMAASFYADNRRVRNSRIKQELGVALRYPSYRQGLADLLEAINREVGK